MEKKSLTYKQWLVLVFGAIIVYWFLQNIREVLNFISTIFNVMMPLLLGFIIAFILNVLMIRFEKVFKRYCKKDWQNKLCRPLSITLSIIIIVVVLWGVMMLVVPELFSTIKVLGKAAPEFFDQIKAWINLNIENPKAQELITALDNAWSKNSKDIINVFAIGFTGMLGSTFNVLSSFFGWIVNFVIALVFAVYILLSKETLKRQSKLLFKAYIPASKVTYFTHVARLSRQVFSSFIIGQFTEAIILGTLCAIGMVIFDFPYAAMIGSLVGITALIPIVGAFIGAAVGGFMIMMINPFQAIMFIIFIIVLQQIEGNLIYPRVVGSSVGLSPIWVLAAITIGGGLFGIIGIILGVPLASILSTLLKEHTHRKLDKKILN